MKMRVLQESFNFDIRSDRLPMPTFQVGSTLRRIQSQGILRVGVNPDSIGFSSINPNTGRFEGLDISFARKVAQAVFGGSVFHANSRVQFVPVFMPQRESALRDGLVDVMISTYAITPKRQKIIDFTDPYYETALSVIVKAEAEISSRDDVLQLPVAVVGNTTGAEFASLNSIGSKIIEVESCSEMVDLVRNGTVGAAIGAASILDGYANSDSDLKRPSWDLETMAFGIGIPKGDEGLREFLNFRIKELVDSGFVALADACRKGGY